MKQRDEHFHSLYSNPTIRTVKLSTMEKKNNVAHMGEIGNILKSVVGKYEMNTSHE
jgi:hypothetical protein